MNHVKIRIICILLILSTLILTSCSGSDKGSVYWLNFKPESDEVLHDVAKLYEEKTGVEVKIVTAASGTYAQLLNSELDKSHPPTIIVLGNNDLVSKWADCCIDLRGTAIEKELSTDSYNFYDSEGSGDMEYSDRTHTQDVNIERDSTIEVSDILERVYIALSEKGYNPVNQIVGYIMSGDPTYITSHRNARSLIMKAERDEILELLMQNYIDTRLK